MIIIGQKLHRQNTFHKCTAAIRRTHGAAGKSNLYCLLDAPSAPKCVPDGYEATVKDHIIHECSNSWITTECASLVQAQPTGGAAASAATNAAAQPAEPIATAAASDACKGIVSGDDAAGSTATARSSGRAAGRNAPAKSKSQEIPKGRTTANQRMTRAAAARAAAELADTAPGSVMEENEEEDEDMDEDMADTHAMQLEMVSRVFGFVCFGWDSLSAQKQKPIDYYASWLVLS